MLSDRSGHTKSWIVAGYGIAGLARPLIALASSWPLALLLREPRGPARAGQPIQAQVAVSIPRPTTAPIRWHPSVLPPALRRYLLVVGLFTLGNASNVFLLLRARPARGG